MIGQARYKNFRGIKLTRIFYLASGVTVANLLLRHGGVSWKSSPYAYDQKRTFFTQKFTYSSTYDGQSIVVIVGG